MSGKTQDRPSSDFILLVDDESQWLERMEKHLMAAGYNCLPVQDVELAIKAIQRLYPMVVLLDLKFYGDFTGWLVAEEALNRQIPSVVVTGHDVSWTRAVSQQYQVIDFIDKAKYDKQTLVKAIAHALTKSRQARLSKVEQQQLRRDTLVGFGVQEEEQQELARKRDSMQPRPLARISIELEFACQNDQPTLEAQSSIGGEYGPEPFEMPYKDEEIQAILKLIGSPADLTNEEKDLLYELKLMTEQRRPVARYHQKIGRTLFNALSVGEIRNCFDLAIQVKEISKDRDPLDVRLCFNDKSVEFAHCPWELIGRRNQHLLKARIAQLSRYVTAKQIIKTIDIQPPIRILTVSPRPKDMLPLSGTEIESLKSEIKSSSQADLFVIDTLSPATFDQFVDLLDKESYDILHFDGHGELYAPIQEDSAEMIGCLDFENAAGCKDRVAVQDLGDVLTASGVELVVLSACNSATIQGSSVYNAIAPALIAQGIPAVVGMQFPITSKSAQGFAARFYRTLAQHPYIDAKVVQRAVTDTRRTLFRSPEWFYPTLYLRARTVRL